MGANGVGVHGVHHRLEIVRRRRGHRSGVYCCTLRSGRLLPCPRLLQTCTNVKNADRAKRFVVTTAVRMRRTEPGVGQRVRDKTITYPPNYVCHAS